MPPKFLTALLVAVFLYNPCLAQAGDAALQEQEIAPTPKARKVKVARTYEREAGKAKGKPYRLVRELHFDSLARIYLEKTFTYTTSVFGIDSALVMQEYTFRDNTNQPVFLKKTYLSIVGKERLKNEVGYAYNQTGEVTGMFVYQPDGTPVSSRQAEEAGPSARGSLQERAGAGNVSSPNAPSIPTYQGMSSRGDWIMPTRAPQRPPSTIPQGNGQQEQTSTVREPLANGYILKEVTSTGRVVSEQKVLLNARHQVSHVITSHEGQKGKPKVVSVTNYVHDTAGREVERTTLNQAGKVVLRYAHTYTPQGQLATTVISEKGKKKREMKYAYEFYD